MQIVFPEFGNPIIQSALSQVQLSDFTPVPADTLESACTALKSGSADAMIAGLECTSRNLLIACRDHLGLATDPISGEPVETFSGCALMIRPSDSKTVSTTKNQESTATPQEQNSNFAPPDRLIVADPIVIPNPTPDQLHDIILQTHSTALKFLNDTPRLALLSYSTLGSGFNPAKPDPSIAKLRRILTEIRTAHPEINIDGELQLDAAINPAAAETKAPTSPVGGQSNILITPDLTASNILYKSLEHFAGYTTAALLLQGFAKPVSDLSRSSSVDDVIATIKTMYQLFHSPNQTPKGNPNHQGETYA